MRLFGLIGYPLTHSFSKDYFAEKFKKEAIGDCRYENFQLANITELPKVIQDYPDLQGLNVTIPYKESVLPFLHEKNKLVSEAGACNCIKIVNKKLIGYNTDIIGFEKSLLHRLQPQHKKALILGTGGAAKAVVFVFKRNRIAYTYVSRRPSQNNITYDDLTATVVEENKL